MQYYFDQFRLSTDTVELLFNEQVVSIDPKMFGVLCFFCQNTDRVISRDELLSEIWKDSIVSENTLNKLIASLRKSLNDDAKSPKFIQTVPKLGYRFICPVTHSESKKEPTIESIPQTVSSKSQTNKPKNKLPLIAISLLIILTVLSLFTWQVNFSDHKNEDATDIQTLTRMTGDKYSPFVAPNGKTLSFLTRQHGIDKLWIRSLQSNELSDIPHSFERIYQIVQWQDSNEITLLVRHNDKKRIMRGQVIDNKLHLLSQSMANLDNWQVSDIAAIKNNLLFMVAKSPQDKQPALYKLDFFQPAIEQIPLDIQENARLSRLDINPTQTRILLLTKNHDDSTSLYQLNIENYAQRHYHTFNSIVRNAIWQHDGEGILYTTPPPAQKVMAINAVKKQKPMITISSSEYLCCDMARIPDGKNLIYRTNIRNFSIKWLSDSKYSINNSTVYDMLPKLFHQDPALAFISKRDGRAQIYVQRGSNDIKAISSFDNYKVFSSLAISPNDEKLIAGEANRLHIFELKEPTTSSNKTITLENRVRSAVWLTNKVLAVTHYNVKQSFITLYDHNGEELKTIADKWLSMLIDHTNDRIVYLIDKEKNIYRTTTNTVIAKTVISPQLISTMSHSINRDTKINGGKLYQIPNYSEKLLISNINAPKKIIATHSLGDSYGFDVIDDQIIFSSLEHASTQLHRTK